MWGSSFSFCIPLLFPLLLRLRRFHTHVFVTPSFSRNFVIRIFVTPNFVTHNLATHHLSPTHTSLSHTTFSRTMFHTQLVAHHLSHTSLSYTMFHTHLRHTHTPFTPSFTRHTQLSHHLTHIHILVRHTHTQLPHTLSLWQAWHLLTQMLLLRGRRGTCGTGLALVARLVAVGRPDRRGTLRGKRGTWRHPLSFCVAGVALLALVAPFFASLAELLVGLEKLSCPGMGLLSWKRKLLS